MLFVLLLLLWLTRATLSPLEAQLVCKYDGMPGFVVPCGDAVNACQYSSSGIVCATQNGTTWTETIISFDLGGVNFASTTTDALPTEIGNLISLQSLRLFTQKSLRQSSIPTEIGLCTQLSSLTLITQGFGGTLPSVLFTNTKLSYIRLASSAMTGTIPTSLSTLTTLTYLSIVVNNFMGDFPSLANLTRLEYIDIRYNQFTGLIPDVSALPRLVTYQVSNNQFHGDVPVFTSSFIETIDLSHNRLNGSFASVPVLYANQTVFFTANANELTGTIPSTFFKPGLVTLDLSHNRLSGTLPREVSLATSLEQLVLSHNELSGTLSVEWQGATFPALFRLRLDHNQFNGQIPSFTMLAQGRQSVSYEPHIYMNMNDNAFNGAVPWLPPFPLSSSLDFSNNALTLVDSSMGDGGNISWLNLASNPIQRLPSLLFADIFTFTALLSLDLSHCQITGTLPEYFHVQYLELNNNYFTGVVLKNFIFQFDASRLPVFADIRLNRLETDAARQTEVGGVSSYLFNEIVLTDFPQDVDECLLGTHECESLCIDGWFPVPGYTCDCPSGFQLDELNKKNCSAVCGDGLLRYPEEACDYEYSRFGCYYNCTVKPGYACDAAGCAPVCGDGVVMEPEECDNTMPGCSAACTVLDGYTCSVETNTCQSCSQSWLPFIYTPNLRLFPNLRAVIGDDLTDFNFASCIACDDGVALQTRAVLATNQCVNMSTQRTVACSFACTNLSVFASATESIYTLQQELLKNDFIQHLFRTIFNANVTVDTSIVLTKKRDVGEEPTSEALEFTISPCVSDKSSMINVLRALSLDIVPNMPNLAVISSSTCSISVRSTNPPAETIISIVLVIGVCAFFVVLAIAASLLYYYRSSELHQLPKDISRSFLDQRLRPWAWEYNGGTKSGYYSRVYDKNGEDYRRVESLLSTHFKRGSLEIESITAVYNPALSTSFINMWRIMTTRKMESPDLFFARTYTKDAEKMKVMEYVDKDLLQFTPYNQDLTLPLIPVLHGTDFLTAEHIAQTGFAALSSLDEGYYGRGIYFTSSLPYTLIYACAKRRPAVVISYINMGNPYPVTERHDTSNSFKGRAIKPGYNSHIVRTNKRGRVYAESDDTLCDEFVIPQESQILPAFIVELNVESCSREFAKWSRTLPEPVVDGAIKAFQAEQDLLSKYTSLDSVISIDDQHHHQVYDI